MLVGVVSVVMQLNVKFRSTLAECKQLNSTGLLTKVGSTNITADKILYNHAIQMVSLNLYFAYDFLGCIY